MDCDFCMQPATRTFPANDVVISFADEDVDHLSVGAWAACNACATLIDQGDRDALVRRGVEEIQKATGMDSGEALARLRVIHRAFWSSKR